MPFFFGSWHPIYTCIFNSRQSSLLLILLTRMHFWLMVAFSLALFDLGIRFCLYQCMFGLMVALPLLYWILVSDCAYINALLAHGSLASGFIGSLKSTNIGSGSRIFISLHYCKTFCLYWQVYFALVLSNPFLRFCVNVCLVGL